MNTTTPYHVNGMTRDHCVAAVTGELSRLDGVHDVAIALHVGSTSDEVYQGSWTRSLLTRGWVCGPETKEVLASVQG
jgi:copper chaperone CopZ